MSNDQDEQTPKTQRILIKSESSSSQMHSSSKKNQNLKKTTEKQKDELIRFFEANPDYVKIVAGNAGDNAMKNKIWMSISRRLNEIEGGVCKSSLKWSKSWADMKVYAKSRAKMAIAGTAPPNAKRPTDLDKRILTVIGHADLLIGWEEALAEEANASSNRQPPPEHDYELTAYQDDDETVDVNFLDETEERLENDEDYLESTPQPAAKRVKKEPIRTIRQAINRFNEGDIMEFYIEDENAEEIQETEYVTVDERPKPKKLKRDPPVQQIVTRNQTPKKQERNDDGQYATALNNLADAMNNVAGAIYTIAETLRAMKR